MVDGVIVFLLLTPLSWPSFDCICVLMTWLVELLAILAVVGVVFIFC
jgi:hypothetical protein